MRIFLLFLLQPYSGSEEELVKYPSGSSTRLSGQGLHRPRQTEKAEKEISFFDRGTTLEEQINESNKYYLEKNLCIVHKKPTPIQVVKMDYPKHSKAVIHEAYFRQTSIVDYNGVCKGYHLDLEARETRNRRSFPLKNFHDHQIVHLSRCLKQNGICFTIIHFSSLGQCFTAPASFVINAYRDPDKSSITLQEIETVSYEVQSGFRPTLPYLEAADKFIADRSKS